jgi:hypothetical protein
MRTFARFGSLLVVASVAACEGSGALELTLSLPTETSLRPPDPRSITVTAAPPGEDPVSNTTVLDNGVFAAGELPIGEDVQIGVVLRDVSNRIVGVGEADQPVDVVGDAPTRLTIPVRRPFVFASAPDGLHSFDPTLDPRDAAFQGKLAGISAPLFSLSVGGDRLAVVGMSAVTVVRTDTNAVTGSVAIPAGARDAAAVPGTHKIAIGHATGISIVDLDAMSVDTAAVGPVDRVTSGPAQDGKLFVYGLVGRVVAPELPPPMGTCEGSSSLVVVDVDAPGVVAPKLLNDKVSDLAAAPDVDSLFAALPCSGQVMRVTGDLTSEIGAPTLEQVASLPRAAVLTVAGGRVWAAGTEPAQATCAGTCTTASIVSCSAGGADDVLYAMEGASVVVQSIPVGGGAPVEFRPPGRRETMIDDDDDAEQHAQVLKSIGVVPLDLVTLPGGQYVSLVTQNRYFIAALQDQISGTVLLPCLDAVTNDWLLFDLASSSVAQRVRTHCDVEVGGSGGNPILFPNWKCEAPPPAETAPSDYQATSVGALFGAR